MSNTLHDLLYSFKEQDYLIIKNNAVAYVNNSPILDHDSVSRAWSHAVVDRLEFHIQKQLNESLQAIYAKKDEE